MTSLSVRRRQYWLHGLLLGMAAVGCVHIAAAQKPASTNTASVSQQPKQSKEENGPNQAAVAVPSLAELQERLDELLKQEEQLRQQNLEAQSRHVEQLQQRRTRAALLAEKLLVGELERLNGQKQIDQLRRQLVRVREHHNQMVTAQSEFADSVRQAAETLLVHLREVPGTEESRQRLRMLSKSSVNSANEIKGVDHNEVTAVERQLDVLLHEIDNHHRHAAEIGVRSQNLTTAAGRRERVELLSIGHARFAYRTADGRLGLALSSPRDASGFRWSEEISSSHQRMLQDIFQSEGDESADSLIEFPLDPTGVTQPQRSARGFYSWLRKGGFVMVPLIGLALLATILIGERCVVLYRNNQTYEESAAEIVSLCRDRRWREAEALAAGGRGAIYRVVSACLDGRPRGARAMEDRVQDQVLHELPLLQKHLGGLATLAAVAPLLGLLGTVTGIIRTFSVMQVAGNANQSLMASGISEALVTTATGLIIAVPIFVIHSLLRGRSEKILSDAERHAAHVLVTIVHPVGGPPEAVTGEADIHAPTSEVDND